MILTSLVRHSICKIIEGTLSVLIWGHTAAKPSTKPQIFIPRKHMHGSQLLTCILIIASIMHFHIVLKLLQSHIWWSSVYGPGRSPAKSGLHGDATFERHQNFTFLKSNQWLYVLFSLLILRIRHINELAFRAASHGNFVNPLMFFIYSSPAPHYCVH